MHEPMCVDCGRMMRCHRNGQPVVVTTDPEKTQLYRYYQADVYKCPECGAKVVVGLSTPIECHEATFDREIEYAGLDLLKVY